MSAWLASGGPTSARLPGQQVDDAAGHVARREHLSQVEPGQREPLRGPARRLRCRRPAPRRAAPRGPPAPARRAPPGRPRRPARDAEGEVRLRHLVDAAEHAGELVGPARRSARRPRRTSRARRARLRGDARGRRDHARQLVGAGLQHLGQAVEDLAAVVGGAAAPRPERGPRRAHRVARVLARGQRRVGEVLAGGPLTGATRPDSDRTLAPPIAELVRLRDDSPASLQVLRQEALQAAFATEAALLVAAERRASGRTC